MGENAPPPVRGSAPPPQSEEINGQNQPFSANFWIFAPSESHFAPSMSPHKKILVPPLIIIILVSCIHWIKLQSYHLGPAITGQKAIWTLSFPLITTRITTLRFHVEYLINSMSLFGTITEHMPYIKIPGKCHLFKKKSYTWYNLNNIDGSSNYEEETVEWVPLPIKSMLPIIWVWYSTKFPSSKTSQLNCPFTKLIQHTHRTAVFLSIWKHKWSVYIFHLIVYNFLVSISGKA